MTEEVHTRGETMKSDPSGQIAGMKSLLAGPRDLRALAEHVGYHRLVGIGSAADGIHESHRWRTQLSRQLIEDYGFRWIGMDCDWLDCRRINQWLCGHEHQDLDAAEILAEIDSGPATTWANEEVAEFLGWLHHRNRSRRSVERIGVHGLDRYSLWRSLREIGDWLALNAPDAPPITLRGSLCCMPYEPDAHHRAGSLRLVPQACESDVVDMLVRERRRATASSLSGAADGAEPQALAAAHHYRIMLHGGRQAWNAREHHMAVGVESLIRRHGPAAKGIIWAHNTHLGDARGTDMARHGVISLGELLRENHPGDVMLVGFAAHRGTVLTSHSWGAVEAVEQLPPASAESHEGWLHSTLDGSAVLIFGHERSGTWQSSWRGQRAVGVAYSPEYDTGSYVKTWMGGRYDALIWVEETTALAGVRVGGQVSV